MQPITFQKNERIFNVNNSSDLYLPKGLMVADWMKKLIARPKLLRQLLKKYESPLNIHHLRRFKDNCKAFEQLLSSYQVRNQVIFARKSNPGKAYLHAAEQIGIGADATDYQELKEALESGIDPEKVVIRAANKNEKLFRLGINYNILTIVESPEECKMLHDLAEERGKRARVGFKVIGFNLEDEKYGSEPRFCVDVIDKFIIDHLGYMGNYVMLEYEGLFIDFDDSIKNKGIALHQCLDLSERLFKYGVKTKFIGIKAVTLSTQQSWYFDEVLSKTMNYDTTKRAKDNKGFGIIDRFADKKKISLSRESKPKTDFLKEILEYKQCKTITVASRLCEKSIQVKVELGKSLLDQSGLTVCRIVSQKKDDSGNIRIGVEMNSPTSFEISKIVEMTPVMICQHPTTATAPVEVLLTSAYDIDEEVLLPYKIKIDQLPKVGDLLVFLNTAADTGSFLKPSVNDLSDLSINLTCTENQGQLTFNVFKKNGAIE